MTPEQYQQIERLYQQALERAAEERAAFLEAACAGDEALRQEVERLLASYERAGSFLETPPEDVATELLGQQQRRSLLGRTLGHYRIRSLLGAGGMGEVYKAVDARLDRVVALKTLSPALTADPTARRRFLREARAASSLSHPSICTIFDVGEEGDLTYIAMQYVEGKTIAEFLLQGPLAIGHALSYAIDITDALEVAHISGLIHRDIKPSNIIINERGIAVVLDFGLAKRIRFTDTSSEQESLQTQLTTEEAIIGTTAYMSPEQVRGQKLDARSDIFSFGILLYEMLTGTRPFDGPSNVERMHAILHDEVKPVSQIRPEVDIELERIISKALRKDPAQRYQSVAEMKLELVRYIQEKGFLISGLRVLSSQTGPLQVAPAGSGLGRRVSLRLALALMAVILLVAAASWLLLRQPDQSDSAWLSSLRHVEVMSWKSELRERSVLGRFSPDGKMIAYGFAQGERRKIWIRQASGGDSIQITKDTWESWSPIWSPDGQQIAYVSQRENQTGIWSIPALGGAPKLLKVLEEGMPELKHWSKNGTTIYYELQQPGTHTLHAFDTASKEATQLTDFDVLEGADISPDEKWIAYVTMKDKQRDLWIRPLVGGPPVQVTNDPASDRTPVWHPDGKRIIYSSERDGTLQLCLAYPDGRPPVQMTFGESDSFLLDVSSDGTKILYTRSKEEGDLWRVNIETGEESEVTSGIGVELWPDAAPDGNMIAFQACKEPSGGRKLIHSSILTKPGESQGQPVQLAADAFDPRWSPDGSKLAFLRQSGNLTNLWTVETSGGIEKQLTTAGVLTGGFSRLPYDRIQPWDYTWSPDGSKIAYRSIRSGQQGIYVISTDSLSEIKLPDGPHTNASLFSPLWSPDGQRIAYVSLQRASSAEAKPVWSVWITGQEQPALLFQSSTTVRLLGWSGSGNEVIIGVADDTSSLTMTVADLSVLQVSAVGSRQQTIARLKSAYFMNIQLSPEAKTIGFVSRQDGRDNIWMIPTSGGEAKKITANPDLRLYFSSISWSPDGKSIYYGKQSKWNLISMIDNFK